MDAFGADRLDSGRDSGRDAGRANSALPERLVDSPARLGIRHAGTHVRITVAKAAREHRDNGQDKGSSRSTSRIGMRRLLGLAAFMPLASRAPLYGRLFFELIRDQRTPTGRKAMLAAALGYVVVGRDLVPDDVPVLGGLDDLVVVVLAVDLFLDGVPQDVLDEKLDDLGIDPRAFAEDVARIRRFTPGPLRRMMRRAPELVSFAGESFENSGIGPRVRSWINT